jgi:hypothetical protein
MRSWSSGKPRLTLEEMQQIARQRGGECLSIEYIRGRARLRWRCREGHEWWAAGESVKAAHWCPHCAIECNCVKRLLGIEKCREMARERGGRCLSDTYVNSRSPLLWECKRGHQWLSRPANVRSGHWCVVCANERKSRDNTNLTIEAMQQLAARKGGKCISTAFQNVYHPLEWQCAIGHRWVTKPANVIAGSWCPECAPGLSERICRKVFEHLFGAAFPKVRPRWLLGTHGAPLELDGYCEQLKLAFKYQGAQHFKPVRQFKVIGRRLSALQARDETKRAECRKCGITLIEIPYTVPNGNIEAHIRAELRRAGFRHRRWHSRPQVDLDQLEIVVDDRLAMCQAMARERGGTCESIRYLGQTVDLQWRCGKGHEWSKSPKAVRRGAWCVICRKVTWAAKHRAETLMKIRGHVAKMGAQLKSKKFVSQNTPLQLLCGQGHRWTTSWASLRHDTGCPACRRLRISGLD